MYKITLYDKNCVSCTSGVALFFTDDLESFEQHWLRLVRSESQKELYARSKAGEIVIDYYSDDPELNIVQHDPHCEIIAKKEFTDTNKRFTLSNAYRWTTDFFVNERRIKLRYIHHRTKYYLIGQYELLGVGQESILSDGDGFEQCATYGNPVLLNTYGGEIEEAKEAVRRRIDNEKDREKRRQLRDEINQIRWTTDMKKLIGNDIKTYCWVTLGIYEEKDEFDLEATTELSEEMMFRLMLDILGQAG